LEVIERLSPLRGWRMNWWLYVLRALHVQVSMTPIRAWCKRRDREHQARPLFEHMPCRNMGIQAALGCA